jgi:hypothetical protein
MNVKEVYQVIEAARIRKELAELKQEKDSIVSAMGSAQGLVSVVLTSSFCSLKLYILGHWFKCSKGHPYYIGEPSLPPIMLRFFSVLTHDDGG